MTSWDNLLQGYTAVNNSNFTTVVNGFSDGVSQVGVYYQAFLEKVVDLVTFVFTAYPSAFVLLIFALFWYTLIHLPSRRIARW